MPPFKGVQVSPPSPLRETPPKVATARLEGFLGSIAIARPPPARSSRAQVCAPSVDR
ncbi:MAG: hypothetical protein GY719_17825 [bacterium]|nr:hypothetical protein [bacterium]